MTGAYSKRTSTKKFTRVRQIRIWSSVLISVLSGYLSIWYTHQHIYDAVVHAELADPARAVSYFTLKFSLFGITVTSEQVLLVAAAASACVLLFHLYRFWFHPSADVWHAQTMRTRYPWLFKEHDNVPVFLAFILLALLALIVSIMIMV